MVLQQGGGCYEFDGNGDYIEVNTVNFPTGANEITYSLWAKFNEVNNDQQILFYYGTDATSQSYYIDQDLTSCNLKIGTGRYGGPLNCDTEATVTDTWYHIVAVNNGTHSMLYVDGILKDTDASSLNLVNTYAYIGAFSGSSDFNGSIDNVQIWDRALNAEEVARLNNTPADFGKYTANGNYTYFTYWNESSVGWTSNYSIADTNGTNSLTDIENEYLISYWNLDTDSDDTMGIVDGSIIGGVTNITGLSSDGDGFNGSISYVDLVNTASAPTEFQNIGDNNNYTLSAWVKTDAAANADENEWWCERTIIELRTQSATTQTPFNFGIEDNFICLGRAASDVGEREIGSIAINDGEWHHVVASIQNNTVNFYVDGSLDVQRTYTAAIGDASVGISLSNMQIGIRSKDSGAKISQIWDGSIDEVAIWNTSLTATQVDTLYKTGLSQHANANITLETRTATSYNISDAGLVGLWGCNDGNTTHCNDELGVNDGTFVNDVAVGDEYGIVGQGLDFDGNGDYVNIGDGSGLEGVSALTVSAWINANDITLNKEIVSKWDNVNNERSWTLTLSSGKPVFAASSDGSNYYAVRYDTALSLDTWYYVTGIYSGGENHTLYLNGEEVSTVVHADVGTVSGALDSNTEPAYIGRAGADAGSPAYFNGSIDEVKVYNRSLSAAEVQNLYELGDYHIEWNAWDNEGVITDGSSDTSTNTGNFFQQRFDFNTNDTDVSAYLLAHNVSADVDTGDSTAPTYSDNSTNNTIIGRSTNFTLLVDDDTALEDNGYYIFSTNNTGVWANDSAVNFTATPEWANVTKTLNDTGGVNVSYKWYLYDNEGNEAITPNYSVITDDPTPTITLDDSYALDSDGATVSEFVSANLEEIENMILNFSVSTTGTIDTWYLNFTANGTNGCSLGNKQSSYCYNWTGTPEYIKFLEGNETDTYNDTGGAQGDRITVARSGDGSDDDIDFTIDEHYNPNVAKHYEALYNFSNVSWQDGADQRIHQDNEILIHMGEHFIPVDADQYKLDFRVQNTSGVNTPTQPLEAWICNSTYTTGGVETDANCALVTSKLPEELQDDGTKFRGIFTKNLINGINQIEYVILRTDENNPNKYYSIKTFGVLNATHTQEWNYSTDAGDSWLKATDGYESEMNINWFYAGNNNTEFIYNIWVNTTSGFSTNLVGNVSWEINATNNYAPLVNIITPDNNASINETAWINWSISEPNNDGTITNVTLSNGTDFVLVTNAFNDTTTYSFDPSSYADGIYNLTVHSCENATADLFCGNDTQILNIDNPDSPTGSLTNDTLWSRDWDGAVTTVGYSESNANDADVTYKIYKDGVDVGSSDTEQEIGTYVYVLNTTGGANWTANANMDTQTLVISALTNYPTTINLDTGTTSDTLGDLQADDGSNYEVAEAAATPGLELYMNFSDYDNYDTLRYETSYDGTHTILAEALNDSGVWVNIFNITNQGYTGDTTSITQADYDLALKFQLRFRMTGAGDAGHTFGLDYVQLFSQGQAVENIQGVCRVTPSEIVNGIPHVSFKLGDQVFE